MIGEPKFGCTVHFQVRVNSQTKTQREMTLIGLPSRPETTESPFIAYRLTEHPQYREWDGMSSNLSRNIAEYRVAGSRGSRMST